MAVVAMGEFPFAVTLAHQAVSMVGASLPPVSLHVRQQLPINM